MVYEKQNDMRKTIENLVIAAELNPQDNLIKENLTLVIEEAIRELEILTKDPNAKSNEAKLFFKVEINILAEAAKPTGTSNKFLLKRKLEKLRKLTQ